MYSSTFAIDDTHFVKNLSLFMFHFMLLLARLKFKNTKIATQNILHKRTHRSKTHRHTDTDTDTLTLTHASLPTAIKPIDFLLHQLNRII